LLTLYAVFYRFTAMQLCILKQGLKMKIDKMTAKYIRNVECILIESRSVDVDNCYHIAKMMHTRRCINDLDLLFNKGIYTKYVYPLYCYIEYINNFLTLERFASVSEINYMEAQSLVNTGREVNRQILDIILK